MLRLVSPVALEKGENRLRLLFHHQKKGEFLNANNSERHLPTKLLTKDVPSISQIKNYTKFKFPNSLQSLKKIMYLAKQRTAIH
jgi:hypothetical protein